jgi:TusE/DsrC/DsvC family sulfur relay protein
MPRVIWGGIEIELDEDGFMQEPVKWSRALAEELAKSENAYPMNENHWKIVDYIRAHSLKFGVAPPIRMVVKKTGIELKQIY